MKKGGHSKKKMIEIRPSAYYITLIALAISNLSVFMLGVVFSNMMGVSMGNIAEQGYRTQAARAALMYDDGSIGERVMLVRKGGGGGGTNAPAELVVSVPPVGRAVLAMYNTTQGLGNFQLQAKNGDISVTKFEIFVGFNDLTTMVRLYKETPSGAEEVASGNFSLDSNYLTLRPTSPLIIKAGQTANFVLFADVIDPAPGSRWYQYSNLQQLEAQLYGVEATDLRNGKLAPVSGIDNTNGWMQGLFLFKSLLSLVPEGLVTTYVQPGQQTRLATYKASSYVLGPTALAELVFHVDPTTLLDKTSFRLYESDSVNSLGDLIADAQDMVWTPRSSGEDVRIRFDVNNDDPQPHDSVGETEHFIINAGQSKYLTLVATAHTAGQVVTTINWDNGTAPGQTTVSGVEGIGLRSVNGNYTTNIIWSDLNFDLYSSSTATSTRGWFNGYGL